MRIVGLDLGAEKYSLCEVKDARVVQRATCRGVRELEELLAPAGTARVAIEACREAWFLSSTLRSWGHEVVLIDTTLVKQLGIGDHGRKTDRIDAEALAIALEASRRRSRRRSAPTRPSGPHRARATRRRIHDVDAGLVATARAEPLFAQLMTVPGVGVIVAAAFISVVDDCRRFRSAHEVEAYLGLVPSEYSSGNVRRIGSITKRGNPYARAMLVEAAQCLLQKASDDPLARWGHAVKTRRGAKIAVVALARRLAGVLWGMWRDGTVYEVERVGVATARGYQRHAQSLELRARALHDANAKLQRRPRRMTKIVAKVKS